MLGKAQKAVREISGRFHRQTVTTSAFFHSLLVEQLGQVAHAYVHGGRHAEGIEEDIADVIVCCLAYLNWLRRDGSAPFQRALEKHKRNTQDKASRAMAHRH